MIIEYREGMDYGIGFNSITGELCGCGIETSTPLNSIDSDGQGQRTEFSVEIITSQANLDKSISISASVGVEAFNWGVSAKAQFVESLSFESKYIYILVRSLIINPSVIMSKEDLKLNNSSIEILNEKRYDDFKSAYGNKYILGFISGSELFSIVEIQTSNSEEKKNISASISANLPIHGCDVSATGSFESTLKNVMKTSHVKVYHYQSGGKNVFITQSFSNFLNNIDRFKQEVKEGHSVRYAAILANYTDFNPPKESFRELTSGTNDTHVDVLQDVYRTLKWSYLEKISVLKDALAYPDKYENDDATRNIPDFIFRLTDKFQGLSNEIQKLKKNKINKTERDQIISMLTSPSDIVMPQRKNTK